MAGPAVPRAPDRERQLRRSAGARFPPRDRHPRTRRNGCLRDAHRDGGCDQQQKRHRRDSKWADDVLVLAHRPGRHAGRPRGGLPNSRRPRRSRRKPRPLRGDKRRRLPKPPAAARGHSAVRSTRRRRPSASLRPIAVRGGSHLPASPAPSPSLPTRSTGPHCRFALPVGAPHLRVAPALVRWRLTRGHRVIIPWRTAADFRRHLPPPERYSATYAPGSRGNWRQHSGRYRFFLLRDWNSASVRNGTYSLSVRVADIRGNAAQARLRLRVQN